MLSFPKIKLLKNYYIINVVVVLLLLLLLLLLLVVVVVVVVVDVTLCSVMYFTDWGNFPAIMRARMDGLFVSPIVDTDIRWPNSVTVDCETDHIYWIDAYYHRIERADLNGLERRVVLSDVNTIYHGFHLLVKGHHIYWSEWWTKTFYRALLPTGVNSLQTPQELMILDNTTIGYHYGFTIVNASAPRRGGRTTTR